MNTVTLKTVKMQDGTSRFRLDSPYHPDLPKRLRAMGGQWNNERKAWYMPADMEPQLRQLCIEFFSTDPLAPPETDLVTVEVQAGDLDYNDTCWLFGREILRRPGRDMSVRVGAGVSIISGGFRSSGGSARYPNIGMAQDGTVIRVRDVARSDALAYQAEHPSSTIIEQEDANRSITFRQAKELAEQFGPLLAKLSEEERHEIFDMLQAAQKNED